MLKIKSNIKQCNLSYDKIDNLNITSTGETVNDTITISANNHKLLTNDSVLFSRQDGSQISFQQEVAIEKIIDRNNFTINGFGEYQLYPNNYQNNVSYKVNGHVKQYLLLNFNTNNGHIFIKNRDEVEIKGEYTWNSEIGNYNYIGKKNLCEGDYVLYDNVFLRQILSDGSESQNLNIVNALLHCQIIGGERFDVKCLIPVNHSGNDDRYRLLITENVKKNKIISNFDNIIFTCDDTRFISDANNITKYGITFKDGSDVYKKVGELEVDFGVGSNFANDLIKEDIFNNEYVEKQKTENVNAIIDYEKYPFSPMYFSGYTMQNETLNETADKYLKENCDKIDDFLKPVKRIEFNLNFREKIYTTTETGEIDYGSWTTDDSKFWNNYTLANDGKKLVYTYPRTITGNTADLLGYLGFNDDDVRYQKDALKKSFLRLSFYDSPYRETQKLLYYSTVYFDTNLLMGDYLRALNKFNEGDNITLPNNQIVYWDTTLSKQLQAKMFCTDRYNDEASADGFYLHLFDKMVSGNTCTTIYMKAEFNNAKNGKIVPMIMPINETTNAPLNPLKESFPRDYIVKSGTQSNIGVDVSKLFNDMYIKIFIKYDYKEKKFVWFLPRSIGNLNNETMTFNLFEPRLNGYDTLSYMIQHGEITDSNLAYGESGFPTWMEDNTSFYWSGNEEDPIYWLDESGKTEENSLHTQTYCLFTTATTLDDSVIVDGVKLFNNKAKSKISSIWIDGIKVSDSLFDEDGNLKTNIFQLPDVPFEIEYETIGGNREVGTWKPTTTLECWKDGVGFVNEKENPQIIHSVNYYFKDDISELTSEPLNELYLGDLISNNNNRRKSTIETTEEIVNTIKDTLGSGFESWKQIPSGMFANMKTLRNVQFGCRNIGKIIRCVGDGAFNNCTKLQWVKNTMTYGVKVIGKNSFAGCKSLKKVDFEDIQVILKEAFQGSRTLSIINFENGLRYIGCGSFGNTKVNNVVIPTTIYRIGNSAFRRCYYLRSFEMLGITDDQSNSELINIGRKVFVDNAIQRYKLRKVDVRIKEKYKHDGGTPLIIASLNDYGYKVQFYNSRKDTFINAYISTETTIIKHYLNSEYTLYLNQQDSEGNNVKSFERWWQDR